MGREKVKVIGEKSGVLNKAAIFPAVEWHVWHLPSA